MLPVKKALLLLAVLTLLGCNLLSGVPIQALEAPPSRLPRPTTYEVLLVCTDCADIDRQIELWNVPGRRELAAGTLPQNTTAAVLQTAWRDGKLYYQVRAGTAEGWISSAFVFPLSGPQPTHTPLALSAVDAIASMVAALPSLPPSPTLTQTLTSTVTPLPTASHTPTPPPSACIPPGNPPVYGIVTRVVDGDTIIVNIQGQSFNVRYIGIDAPAFYPWGQFFGAPAKARNAELVLNRVVRLAADAVDQDEYGQLLRYVLVGDIFVNYALVRYGFARPHILPQNFACLQTFLTAEDTARQEMLGLWQPVTPTTVPTNTPVRTATPTQATAPTNTPSPTNATSPPDATPTLTPTSTSETSETNTPTSTATDETDQTITPTTTQTSSAGN